MTKRKYDGPRPYRPLPHSHPLVKKLYDLMQEQGVTQTEVSREGGLSIQWFSHIRRRSTPRVDSLEAAYNVLGYTLQPVPFEKAYPLNKGQEALVYALRRHRSLSLEDAAAETGLSAGSVKTYTALKVSRAAMENALGEKIHYTDARVWIGRKEQGSEDYHAG